LLWHDDQFEPHVRAAGKWLAGKQDLAHDSQRWYPRRIENGVVPYWEAYYRLPLLWYCGVDSRQLVDDLFKRIANPNAVPGDKATAPLYWGYYDLMGVPRSFYLGGGD
jgi:hypothetical protein